MQESANLDVALANIRSSLERYHGQSRTGAMLHTIIAAAAPDLDIRSVVGIPAGPGALKKFIETFLSDSVTRIGNKGGDILYGIGGDSVSLPHAGHSPHEDASKVWKAFVSPNAVNYLFLNMSDLKLIVSERLLHQDCLRQIDRVSEEEHDEIRQGFRTTLSHEQQTSIDEHTAQNLSYDAFVQALRSNGLMKSWGIYRRDAFERILAVRLEQIPLDKELVTGVTGQLIASQQAAFRQKELTPAPSPLPPRNRSSEITAHFQYEDLGSIRDLARRAIEQMSYNDIRLIHLPLGAIIDALNIRS